MPINSKKHAVKEEWKKLHSGIIVIVPRGKTVDRKLSHAVCTQISSKSCAVKLLGMQDFWLFEKISL